MATAYEDKVERNCEDQHDYLRDEPTRDSAFAEPLDSLDLRLIQTFPASDAIAQY